MKKRSGFLGKVVRTYFGILCLMIGIGCIAGIFSKMKDRIFCLPLGLVFLLLALSLFKKKASESKASECKGSDNASDNASENASELFVPQFPDEVLKDMRKVYTVIQAQDDFRIMKDCFSILQTTANFETFSMRYESMCKKAYTLLEAEQAKCKGIEKLQVNKACELVLSNTQNLKIIFLDNSYKHEYESAMTLKTAKGQYNRMEKYLNKLIEHEDDFIEVSEAYEQTKNKAQNLLDLIKKQGQE